MARILTDIPKKFAYSDQKSNITNENLDNGNIAFCSEDDSITLKYNDKLYTMGGTELVDATTTTKGIVKLSSSISSNDSTTAATSKAVKTTYDQLASVKTKANEAYTLSQSLVSRVTSLENIYYLGDVIGVACTGTYSNDGATLEWIDGDFNKVKKLPPGYFNSHPSFNFEETTKGSDSMIKIPIAYWWRGTIPSGPYQGKWGMLLSPTANPGISGITFKPNYVAFMNNGTMYNQFYYSKYRARNAGSNVPVSMSGGTQWKSITFNNAETYCANKGTGWHLHSCQQWHEICARAVVEKKTFQLVVKADRLYSASNTKTRYRGIMEFCEDTYDADTTNGVRAEWMNGIRSKQLSSSSGERIIQTFSNDGMRTWVDAYNTSKTGNGSYYSPQFVSNQYMDNLFINDPKVAGTLGTNAIIPDYIYIYATTSYTSGCYSAFNFNNMSDGAFCVNLHYNPTSSTSAGIGFRSSFVGA